MLVSINNAKFQGEHKVELFKLMLSAKAKVKITTDKGMEVSGDLQAVLNLAKGWHIQINAGAAGTQNFHMDTIAKFEFGGAL